MEKIALSEFNGISLSILVDILETYGFAIIKVDGEDYFKDINTGTLYKYNNNFDDMRRNMRANPKLYELQNVIQTLYDIQTGNRIRFTGERWRIRDHNGQVGEFNEALLIYLYKQNKMQEDRIKELESKLDKTQEARIKELEAKLDKIYKLMDFL